MQHESRSRFGPRAGALSGIVLGAVAWFVLLFGGFGGERAVCPETGAVWVNVLAIACAIVATVGFGLAIWAYRESAGEPSGECLVGAAGLYVTTLAWAATVTGAVALLAVDLCSF